MPVAKVVSNLTKINCLVHGISVLPVYGNTGTIFKLGGFALHAINDSLQHARGLKSSLCSDEVQLTP